MIERLRKVDRMAWLLLLLRLGLGSLFVMSSLGKLQEHATFINDVVKYGLLPEGLARFYGTMLPWMELFIGFSLILGIFAKLGSVLSVPLIVSFIVANSFSVITNEGGLCECLGRLARFPHSTALAIDCAMLVAAGLLLYASDKASYIGVGHLLAKGKDIPGLQGSARAVLGMAVIVLAMVVAVSLTGGSQRPLGGEVEEWLKEYDAVVVFFYNEDRTGLDIIRDLELQYGRWVFFQRLDHPDDPGAAEDYDIDTFPTVLVITSQDKKGVALEGPVDKAALEAAIEEALSGGP